MAQQVVEHEVGKKFYISLDTGEEAVLEYEVKEDGSLDLHHTEVPQSQRGKGIGGILAEAAFEYATKKEAKVILTCSYLQHYSKKHPEHNKIILS